MIKKSVSVKGVMARLVKIGQINQTVIQVIWVAQIVLNQTCEEVWEEIEWSVNSQEL